MMRCSLCAAIALAWLAPLAVAGTVDVDSPHALAEALQNAGPATTIRLAPGDYGSLTMQGLTGRPGAPLVITSADPTRPAQLSALVLRQVADLEVRDLLVDYTFSPGDEEYQRVVEAYDSREVTFSGLIIDGDVARGVSDLSDGFPTGQGLIARNMDGFIIENSEVRGFASGIGLLDSQDVTVRANDLHSMRRDGITVAQVSHLLIEGNWIHDFDRSVASGDHPDMIQFWTTNTSEPSSDVLIQDNLLSSGDGAWTQSIFIRNEEVDQGRRSFADMAYRNLRIENNVIINAHLHGIAVGETDGLVVLNNAVLRNVFSEGEDDNPDLWTPQIRVSSKSRNVIIERNVTSAVSGAESQSDWQVSDNLLVQDRGPSRPGYYASVFSGMPTGDPRDPATFAPRVGGPLDKTGIGPAWLGRRVPG